MAKKQGITWTNERRKLSDLIPWERNPRTINNAQAERLVDSVETFGQVETLAIDCRNGVLNGHQRLNVLAGQYGMDYEVDVRVANRVLTERERQQLTVYLHRGTTGAWDFEELANSFEFEDLVTWGFSEEELLGLDFDEEPTSAGADTEPQIDKAEELRVKWNVSGGQLWALGEHRLICGDCTDAAVVARVMGGEKATLAPVDPPYNVGFDYDGETVDDQKQADDYERFSRTWFGLCQSVSLRQIVTPGCNNLALWLRWFDAKHWAPWTKTNSMTNGVVSRFWCWEPVLFFGEKWNRLRSNDIFDYPIGQQRGVANHPCPKPLKMWENLIENYSAKGDTVFESFCGSGTTLIACHNLGRKCRAVEISPNYVGVAIERFYQHTNIEPVLIS